jgi:hypothetical protein
MDSHDDGAASMRYTSKQALLHDIRTEHELLLRQLEEIPNARWREPGVWGDGWSLCDLVAHLAEWQRMFLGWYGEGLRGATPRMPAPGYRWSETPALNRAIREKHRVRSRAAIRADFDSGYTRIVRIVGSLTPGKLLEPGHYPWTGRNPLATYIGPNTASHYRFAVKVIKRWLKGTAGTDPSAARPNKRLQPTARRQGKRRG